MVDFLVIGPFMAVRNRIFFKGLKDGTIFLGYCKRGMEFINNDCTVNSCWFNNLSRVKDNEFIILSKTYNDNDYDILDNYDAINITDVEDIPMDYTGEMVVPITFLDKWNYDQFELIGLLTDNKGDGEYFFNGTKTYVDEKHRNRKSGIVNGKMLFDKLLIKKKN